MMPTEIVSPTVDNTRMVTLPEAKALLLLPSDEELYVPLDMPKRFDFSAAILHNYGPKGALHSYLRHQTDWLKIIPRLSSSELATIELVIKGIGKSSRKVTIQSLIQRIGESSLKAPHRTRQLGKQINEFKHMDVAEFNRIQSIFNHSQLAITEWIQMLFKDGKYLGEDMASTLFRINGETFAVGFSDQEYYSNKFDQRPMREVITAYKYYGECPSDITKMY